MIASEAKRVQDELAKHYDLSFWYGTNCKKCCGVFPKLFVTNPISGECYYKCEVCEKRTKLYSMPWLARDAWNNDEVEDDNALWTLI